jgi:hypothetical protein
MSQRVNVCGRGTKERNAGMMLLVQRVHWDLNGSRWSVGNVENGADGHFFWRSHIVRALQKDRDSEYRNYFPKGSMPADDL